MEPIRLILHPTDLSAEARPAFRMACSLARDHGARLVILHVVPPPYPLVGEMVAIPPLAEDEEERVRMRERLYDEMHTTLPMDPELDMEYRVEEGETVAAILEAARSLDANMIVLGTHGRTGLRRLLMGSVAELVVRRAPCAVLTVKGPVSRPVEAETVEPEMFEAV
jgi:nucleotide-binding universal stress UspA family protein